MNGEIPAYTIYEDEVVNVFLDINPEENGHLLIVPKVHTMDLDTIDSKTLLHTMEVAQKMKKWLEKSLQIEGVTMIQNNGIAQEIKHFHLHLIPKYRVKQAILPAQTVFQQLKELL